MNYAQVPVPGLSAPILQFVSGGQQVLEMELFLDTREGHREGSRQIVQPQEDVRRLTRMITDLMEIEPTTHAPPVLLFTWGSLAFSWLSRRVWLRDLGMRAHLAGENGFTFGLLYGGEQALATDVEDRMPVVRKAVRAAGRRLR